MSTSDQVWSDCIADLRRMGVVALVSIPLAAEMVFGELLFAGHIVFLVEALGFAWGLIVFIVVWAALGVAVLAIRDFAWAGLSPALGRLRTRAKRLAGLVAGARAPLPLTVPAVAAVLAGGSVALSFAGDDLWGWARDHRSDVIAFMAAAFVVFLVLLAAVRVGRSVRSWIERTARGAGPTARSLATVTAMAMLGPALAWPVLHLFGYSSRSVYALTLLSAPVFGGVWVPFYVLGVWSVIQRLF